MEDYEQEFHRLFKAAIDHTTVPAGWGDVVVKNPERVRRLREQVDDPLISKWERLARLVSNRVRRLSDVRSKWEKVAQKSDRRFRKWIARERNSMNERTAGKRDEPPISKSQE